jgi:hypothetical protein
VYSHTAIAVEICFHLSIIIFGNLNVLTIQLTISPTPKYNIQIKSQIAVFKSVHIYLVSTISVSPCLEIVYNFIWKAKSFNKLFSNKLVNKIWKKKVSGVHIQYQSNSVPTESLTDWTKMFESHIYKFIKSISSRQGEANRRKKWDKQEPKI